MLLKLLLALAEPKNKKVKPQKKTATQKSKEKAELERRLWELAEEYEEEE